MGLFRSLKTIFSWAKEAEASGVKWGRIVGVGSRTGPLMKIDLDIHYLDDPPFRYSTYQVVPRGVTPEVGQDVAIVRDSGVEATSYAIDWKKPPQYGKPWSGVLSEAERERLEQRIGRPGPEDP